MQNKKINILYNFKDGPWGGGNQFLKALRNEFIDRKVYENNPKKSSFILFNSHQNLEDVLKLKLKYSNKIFIHRVDGPVICTRGKGLEIDKLILKFSQEISDITIFQSNWSYKKCKELGFNNNKIIIYNAPDYKIFNTEDKKKFDSSEKIRMISTSWSPNLRKGFEIYKYLDENLDFNIYEFIFIGNSPISFKNIKCFKPLPSIELAKELKKSDIYITASKNDPCSNSLIEALACGLPAIALNDGGHPELIKKGGELFNNKYDILSKIEKIVCNYENYKKNIPEYNIKKISSDYLKLLSDISISRKKIGKIKFIMLRINIIYTKIKGFLELKFFK